MEKKPFDYLQLNPKALLATPEGKELRLLKFNIFQADGSPARLRPLPTEESAQENLTLILKAVPETVDPRELIEALLSAAEMVSNAIDATLDSVHTLGHQIEMTSEWDISIDKVHTAIDFFKDPDISDEVTAENSNEVLDRFFVGDKKPN